MTDPDLKPLAQASRLIVLLSRWWRLRLAMVRLDAAQRLKALIVGLGLILAAVLMLVMALVFALMALAAVLQSSAGLSPAAAYAVVAGAGVGLALVLGLLARAGLRRALRPVNLKPIQRDRRS